MSPQPLLLVSDAISASSGLARITRDLAVRIYDNLGDAYRVGTAGYGGIGNRHCPWPDYHFNTIDDWLLPELPQVVNDFAPGEECIVMFVWDLSRVRWFADPAACPNQKVKKWLERGGIKKWLYHPIDADGPNGKLDWRLAQIMGRFDRVLDYTAFSCAATGNVEHLPHGIDTEVFFPRDRSEARQRLIKAGFKGLEDKSLLVGIVATNQPRKDWALGIQTCAELLKRGHDIKMWLHTDLLERHWSLPGLISSYGLKNRVVVMNGGFLDDTLASFYSACSITLGIGAGEGFGFPIFESLACGIPCVHGNYAGAAEYLTPRMKVDPVAYRYEGPYCCRRPVHDPIQWADAVEDNLGLPVSLPESLDWKNLWPRWEAWLREGVDDERK